MSGLSWDEHGLNVDPPPQILKYTVIIKVIITEYFVGNHIREKVMI